MKKHFLLFSICVLMAGYIQAFNITFKVDMSTTSGFTTPEVNGTFNGWCGACAQMTDIDLDNVWEITIDLAPGTYEYKFAADNWNIEESLTPGSSCTVTSGGFTNRVITVTGDAVLPEVCWASCNDCGVVPTTYPVTFSVDMSAVTDPFTTPTVNGSFDGFCGNCHPMTDANLDNIWEVTLNLESGSYEYKFAADNWNIQETLIPGSPCTVTNFGFTNRTLTVGTSPVTQPEVCWGHCVNCASVNPYYDITFQVDMNQQTGFTIPEVNGVFNGWCGNCNAMTDANNDGIWETTIALQAGSYEYKFSHDSWLGEESLTEGSPCTVTNAGFTNRLLTVTGDATLQAVCYGSCSACAPPTYNVTFQVDMNNESGFTTPEVNGSFNGWCGNCAPMTDGNNDGVWELTIPLSPGSYEFKYSYDNWGGEESLIPGSSCTVTNFGFTNRILNVVDSDIIMPVNCFASCAACSAPPSNVTFRVNMNQVSGFTTPELNGSFNGWCGNCTPMTDANNDGIWEVTVSLQQGSYEYKFSYDAWTGEESLTEGSSCTVTNFGFTNRIISVGPSDMVLDIVCYGSCSNCIFPSNDGVADAQNTQTTGLAYPAGNCFTGTLVGATVSPEGNAASVQPSGGQDTWYKVVLPSSGIRVSVNSTFDAVIELHNSAFAWIDSENVIPAAGTEIMSTNGLTPGSTYYIAVRSFSGTTGTFSICIQALMESSCDDGSGTYDLCTNFKPNYTGANQYVFHFTPVSFAGPTVTASSVSQIPLSSPGLSLRHGETYDVTVDGVFNLSNGGGTPDAQTIIGSEVCTITIAAHADLRTKIAQRCPSTVFKGTTLQAKPFVCAAINHTITFREVGDCVGSDIGAVAFTTTTSNSSPTKKLSQVAGVQAGKWYEVTWTPNFAYGPGTPGTTDIIYVAGSTEAEMEVENDITTAQEFAIYPNPNDGNSIVLNGTDFPEANGIVRIYDATGRIVFTERIAVNEAFTKVVLFDNQLKSGLYVVELTVGNDRTTARLIVQ